MFQESSLDFKLVQRVCLLQQALGQATESLEQLQKQLEDYQVMESQLAQTEQYSNLQQKIITNLQQQLTEKSDWQNQVLLLLLTNAQTMIDQQSLILGRLWFCIQQSQTEVQNYLQRLTQQHYMAAQQSDQPVTLHSEVMIVRNLAVSLSSQLQAAQEQIRDLNGIVSQYQAGFAHMQAYVDHTGENGESVAEQPAITIPDDEMACLAAQVQSQAARLAELEHELNQQFHHQTQLRYRYQSLAAERDNYRKQLETYRQANQDLQEQVLEHTRQRGEYEAEIYYWKQQAKAASHFSA
ncbi:hypothetical protein C7271_22200 [filamentous cyanobacterium CCP5]|nr:hypothetical protein C7271_22200 [filamentous cyanobacterium CCP5]